MDILQFGVKVLIEASLFRCESFFLGVVFFLTSIGNRTDIFFSEIAEFPNA